MKPVLNYKKIQCLESLLQHVEIGEGNYRICGNHPERSDLPADRCFNDVGIGESARSGDAICGDTPQRCQFLPILYAVELAIPGKTRGKSRFAGSHRVALAGDGEGRSPNAADIARDQRQIVDRVYRLRALGAVINAHCPSNESRLGVAVERGSLENQVFTQPSDFSDVLKRVFLDELRKFRESARMLCDELAVNLPRLNQYMDDSVDQRNVRSRLQRQEQICHHCGLGNARIGDDESLSGIGLQMLAKNRMVVGDVRTDQEYEISFLEVFVRAGRPIAAKRPFVAGNGAGHTQRCVAVIVLCRESELHEFAECVELFCNKLSRTHHTESIAAVSRLRVAKLRDQGAEGFLPADRNQFSALPEKRSPGTVRSFKRVVL